ncbi:MAG TPA: hypothetical protein VF753_18600 [Terriglobales bacterium]
MKKWWIFPAFFLLLTLAGCSHQPPPPPPPPPPSPAQYRELGQQGLNDGYYAAKNDVAMQRPPNVEAQDLFRNPPVPPEAAQAYRQSFRNGYNAYLHGAPAPPPPPPPNQ